MIKKSFAVLSVAAASFISAQNVSTIRNTIDVYSTSVSEGSAKYNSMAGSMGALGGDFSVLNSNPAGLGVSVASEFSGTLSINTNKSSTSLGSKSIDYKLNNTDIGNVGGLAAFNLGNATKWKFVNIGVNFSSRPLEEYSETPGDAALIFPIKDNTGTVIDNLTFDGHAYNRSGRLSKMSFGVGGNYDHRIYVGAGLNFHNAQIDQFDTAAFLDKNGRTDYYNKQYTPFSEMSTGFSASVGVIGKVSPQFRLGAALETPTWWNVSRIYDEYENPTDGTYAEERNLSTPMKATVSAAFVPNKNFAFNVDYSLGLTKAKYSSAGNAARELNRFFADNTSSVSEVKVGAEYRYEGFRVRGGYGYASDPVTETSLLSLNGASAPAQKQFGDLYVGTRNTVAAGLGYDFKSFYVDAAYQHIQSDYSSPFLQGSSTSNSGYFGSQYIVDSSAAGVSQVKSSRDNFFVTLGWKF